MTVRICRECRWHHTARWPDEYCTHPKSDQRKIDVVTGWALGSETTSCRKMRDTHELCGPTGILWEAKLTGGNGGISDEPSHHS